MAKGSGAPIRLAGKGGAIRPQPRKFYKTIFKAKTQDLLSNITKALSLMLFGVCQDYPHRLHGPIVGLGYLCL
jgi:hypothetical protein